MDDRGAVVMEAHAQNFLLRAQWGGSSDGKVCSPETWADLILIPPSKLLKRDALKNLPSLRVSKKIITKLPPKKAQNQSITVYFEQGFL